MAHKYALLFVVRIAIFTALQAGQKLARFCCSWVYREGEALSEFLLLVIYVIFIRI